MRLHKKEDRTVAGTLNWPPKNPKTTLESITVTLLEPDCRTMLKYAK
jgi:hypothetical protein